LGFGQKNHARRALDAIQNGQLGYVIITASNLCSLPRNLDHLLSYGMTAAKS